jgi:hypothetical protein
MISTPVAPVGAQQIGQALATEDASRQQGSVPTDAVGGHQ